VVEHKPLALKMVQECDCDWVESVKVDSMGTVAEYQLFILCKIIMNDMQLRNGTVLSPSPQVKFFLGGTSFETDFVL
jgi:hypothetical protein